jgi:hypothetical protein
MYIIMFLHTISLPRSVNTPSYISISHRTRVLEYILPQSTCTWVHVQSDSDTRTGAGMCCTVHGPTSADNERYKRYLVISSGISEHSSETTKTDAAERSISRRRGSLQVWVTATMVYLQVSPIGGSHDKTWWGQETRKHCVLEFDKTESLVTVQQRFQTKYHTEPPTNKTISEWYKKFQQSGCLCTSKWTDRPGPSAETVKHVHGTSVRSPRKSTHRTSRELQMPQSSVWRILCKCLLMKGYLLLNSLGQWPQLAHSFCSTQAATLLELVVPLTNCFVHRWFCVVLGLKPPLHYHNLLSFGKFQNTEHFLILCPHHVLSQLPPAVKPACTPWCLLPKLGEILWLLIFSFLLSRSWLLHCRVQSPRRTSELPCITHTPRAGTLTLFIHWWLFTLLIALNNFLHKGQDKLCCLKYSLHMTRKRPLPTAYQLRYHQYTLLSEWYNTHNGKMVIPHYVSTTLLWPIMHIIGTHWWTFHNLCS